MVNPQDRKEAEEHRLNREQFGPHLPGRDVNPHQLALPGMEKVAHPWAEHLARGYTLQYGQSRSEHHLQAWDLSHPKYPTEVAHLDWKKKRGPIGPATYPGEISMVQNLAREEGSRMEPKAKGLAGALMRSAHYFNFGQDTVPIHSPVRSFAGEHFASTVMPELKPDVWNNYISEEHTRAPGKPPSEYPKWPHTDIKAVHPFQKAEIEARNTRLTKIRGKTQQVKSGQGTLF